MCHLTRYLSAGYGAPDTPCALTDRALIIVKLTFRSDLRPLPRKAAVSNITVSLHSLRRKEGGK